MSKPTSINVVNKPTNITVEDLSEPLTYSVEAFISPEYAKAEADRHGSSSRLNLRKCASSGVNG